MFEFHISRFTRDKYQFEDVIFSFNGNAVLADFAAARRFAERMNTVRQAAENPQAAVMASDINAMGLIDEVWHYLVMLYRQRHGLKVMLDVYDYVEECVGAASLQDAIQLFCLQFPPVKVYRGEISLIEYLAGSTDGLPHRVIALEEMLMLALSNENPAFKPFIELFDDRALVQAGIYPQIIRAIDAFFAEQPPLGGENLPLTELLRLPFRRVPDSLSGQLQFIRDYFAAYLTGLLAELLLRVLGGLDFLTEEHKPRGLGPGPAPVLRFGPRDLEEVERFSPDLDWMPKLVLMAKSTYVWLHQLSNKYGRPIERLDQIPDDELEQLARFGFTGLWLIGIWERSSASRKIKQWNGNPEAKASAYSIYDYTVAAELGGEEAFESLKERAWRYGIRMATDMVPNHMGLYSKWLIEHPDWFIQLGHSPFEGYRFSSENLSEDERVLVQIEDGYWNRTDAAVVFKRTDRSSGDTRYIYHGNDGTSMPWNDTAQLNLTLPEVREAVIQTTIAIAKRFPVIRFDAAMTLTKRHFQRLWFPLPGCGGDIPSRAENSMSDEDFQRLFPHEFWRELVDRIALEAPDTLLLAEAFWLMEGYFVRSLGMHRVYNSAFMNMLKAEENSKYRDVIKNILKFNPEILRRFVNFMNNPDEEPAVAQFGKGDKYFGVATLMVTMPGLPMFGHGQIEGFSEKYGMEYARAYWDEPVDWDLVERHKREIFPLMRLRHLFSGVEHFVLYDCFTSSGYVNEDVFAYSNQCGSEKALVVYNNRYERAEGWVKTSVAMNLEIDGSRRLVQKDLCNGLSLRRDDNCFYILKDAVHRLEYLRSARQLSEAGLKVALDGFQLHVFLGFDELCDPDGSLCELERRLAGGGVADVRLAYQELRLADIVLPLKAALAAAIGGEGQIEALARLLAAVAARLQVAVPEPLGLLAQLEVLNAAEMADWLVDSLPQAQQGSDAVWRRLASYAVLRELDACLKAAGSSARDVFDEWLIGHCLKTVWQAWGLAGAEAEYELGLIKILLRSRPVKALPTCLLDLLEECEIEAYCGFNTYEGVEWFNREAMQNLIANYCLSRLLEGERGFLRLAPRLFTCIETSGYRLAELKAALKAVSWN